MTFVDAVKSGFKNYANFSGVASRAEYWYFALFGFLVTLVASTLDGVFGGTGSGGLGSLGSIGSLVSIALVLPRLTLNVRRFRDAGFSPWLLLLGLLPVAAVITWIVTLAASAGPNAFDGLTGDTNNITNAQLQALIAPFTTPAALAALGVVILTTLGVGIFFFVVTLLPGKSIEQGNRILAKEVARQQPIA